VTRGVCAVCGAPIIYVISDAGHDTWGSQSEWQHTDSLIDLDHYAEEATPAPEPAGERLQARLAELNTREPADATAADDPAMDTIVDTAVTELHAARTRREAAPRPDEPGTGPRP